ncbi:MAG TPA: hypothetical protein VI298_00365 [Geobacteraceae bacterium]
MKLMLAALFLSLLAQAAAAGDYDIRLHRPMHAGEKFRISATGSNAVKTVIKTGGELFRDDRENFSVEFDSLVTVLATDRNGKPTRESVAVLKCEKTEAFDRKALLAPGTVVVASAKGKDDVYEIDGKPVDREMHEVLAIFVPLGKGEATDDEIFGTRERKRVGDAWGVNADLAAREFEDFKLGVRKENIAGKTTLEKIVRSGAADCLLIRSEVTFEKLAPPLPSYLSVESSLMRADLSGEFPVDTDAQPPEEKAVLTFTFVARGKPAPAAPEVVIESSFERHVTERVERVKAGE